MIRLSVNRAGACMFDVLIRGDMSDMPALLPDDKQSAYYQNLRDQENQAMMMLDAQIGKLGGDCVIGIFPWHTASDVFICRRSFSALVKEGQACISAWIKACQGKLGKSLIVE